MPHWLEDLQACSDGRMAPDHCVEAVSGRNQQTFRGHHGDSFLICQLWMISTLTMIYASPPTPPCFSAILCFLKKLERYKEYITSYQFHVITFQRISSSCKQKNASLMVTPPSAPHAPPQDLAEYREAMTAVVELMTTTSTAKLSKFASLEKMQGCYI